MICQLRYSVTFGIKIFDENVQSLSSFVEEIVPSFYILLFETFLFIQDIYWIYNEVLKSLESHLKQHVDPKICKKRKRKKRKKKKIDKLTGCDWNTFNGHHSCPDTNG